MSDLHPNKYGSSIDNDVTTGGRNRNDGIPPESSYLRCKKCGYTLSKVKRPKGWGQGRTQPATKLPKPVNAGDTTINVVSTADFPATGSIYIYDTRFQLPLHE